MKEIHGQCLRLGVTLFYSPMILVHQMIVVHLLVDLFSSIRRCEVTWCALDYSIQNKIYNMVTIKKCFVCILYCSECIMTYSDKSEQIFL